MRQLIVRFLNVAVIAAVLIGYNTVLDKRDKEDQIARLSAELETIQLQKENLREQMYRYRIEYLKKKECYPQLLNEHQTIIDAIAGHDKELATKFTSQHIKNQAETVVGTIREKEENA